MFDVDKWLNEDCEGEPRHKRICFLIVANGGKFNVRGWGLVSHYSGHQIGLDQNQAFELLLIGSYISGLSDAGVPVVKKLGKYYEAYLEQINQTASVLKNETLS